MRNTLKKMSTFNIVTIVAIGFLSVGAVAYACTNLATLNLSGNEGAAGADVTITGSAFGTETDVILHWNSVDGEVLTTATPDATGNISAAITVPEMAPGAYVIVATQATPDGGVQFGTPARATFQVAGPGGVFEAPATNTGQLQVAQVTSGDTTSTALLVVTIALGIAGLALFGAGVAGFARQVRRSDVPVTVRSE